MNALQYAISEIKNQIPHEILYAAFTIDDLPETVNLTSLEHKITYKLLKNRVAMDCNIFGGVETIIPLGDIQPISAEAYYTVYQIPPDKTLNKEIIAALSLTFLPIIVNYATGDYPYAQYNVAAQHVNSGSAIMANANRISTAAADTGVLNNAHLELIGYNTVLVQQTTKTFFNFSNYGLKCLVENNENFSNIQIKTFKAFSTLCVLACKSYIYHKLLIAINNGYLQSGQELGVFKSVVDGYETSEEDYYTYLNEKWRKISMMNDTTRYNTYLRTMVNPGL